MNPLPFNEDLEKVARRVVWFTPPKDALREPYHFVAHVLTYGLPEDVAILLRYISREDLKDAIIGAPPGIWDSRSWAYWNVMIGRYPTPPMPKRMLPR